MIRIMLVDDQRFARDLASNSCLTMLPTSSSLPSPLTADPPSRRSNSSPFSIVHCRM